MNELAIFGGGPAGLGPLVSAAQRGQLDAVLARGIAIFEASRTLGAGSLGRYAIRSDTRADVLLECLSFGAPALEPLRAEPITEEVASYGQGPLPLSAVGRFLARLGASLERAVLASRSERVLDARLVRIRLGTRDHEATLHIGGREATRAFRHGILALGGEQRLEAQLDAPWLGDRSLRALGVAAKCVAADAVLAEGGLEALGLPAHARVVISGGSHGALAVAAHLLQHTDATVRILCRRTPKPFYATESEARADGLVPFDARDVCPTTGRVFRLAGLRFDGRELLRRVLRGEEPRVTLGPLDPEPLAHADRIVVAHGYRPRTVPIVRHDGTPVVLAADRGGPLVDATGAILDAEGRPLPGLSAIGLASGFLPSGPMGGEPSFRGQTNGLWLYQNHVGAAVLARALG